MEDIFESQTSLKDLLSDEIIKEILHKKEIKKVSKIHTDGPWVYFIMAGSEKWSPIKIGFTNDILKRFDQIKVSTHANVRLICAITGGRDLEKFLHNKFKEDRIKGEWFRQTSYILKKIDELYELNMTEEESTKYVNNDGVYIKNTNDNIKMFPTDPVTFFSEDIFEFKRHLTIPIERATELINSHFKVNFSKKKIREFANYCKIESVRTGTKRGFRGIGEKSQCLISQTGV